MSTKNKRNAQGGGTIRQRPDGRWEARYTVGRDPGTGKQVQRSVYGKTQKEVRQKLQQACIAIDDGMYSEPNKMTLSQWLDIWFSEYTGEVKPLTLKSYNVHINNHLKPALGAVKLSALSTPRYRLYTMPCKRAQRIAPGFHPKPSKIYMAYCTGRFLKPLR